MNIHGRYAIMIKQNVTADNKISVYDNLIVSLVQ